MTAFSEQLRASVDRTRLNDSVKELAPGDWVKTRGGRMFEVVRFDGEHAWGEKNFAVVAPCNIIEVRKAPKPEPEIAYR